MITKAKPGKRGALSAQDRKYVRRFQALAKLLDGLPEERFDYGTWGESRSCGTVACALGWAASTPWAKRVGVSLKPSPYFDSDLQIHYKGADDAQGASEAMFGISDGPDWNLWMPGATPARGIPQCSDKAKPSDVATKIRKYVAKKFGVTLA